MTNASITLIGGPTALIELLGMRFLTDPTFDDPGDYLLPHVRLKKTSKPAMHPAEIGAIDAVLLSHDQHADNLDISGRAFLPKARLVFTTAAGADRPVTAGTEGGRTRPADCPEFHRQST